MLNNSGYWFTETKMKLFRAVDEYMRNNSLDEAQLAERIGVDNDTIKELLNGDLDCTLSQLSEIAVAIGFAPKVEFVKIED